ncbi:MAG: hypothetical protein AB1486_07070 [Planctomycetota bacterium]
MPSPHVAAVRTEERHPFSFRVPLRVVLILALCNWLTFFSAFDELGVYFDDWNFFLSRSADEFSLARLWRFLRNWPQGRPLYFATAYPVGDLLHAIGGLQTFHLFGFLLKTLNGILLYLILRHAYPQRFALMASVAYLLMPLVQLKAFITGYFAYDLPLLLVLLGITLYLRGRRILAYVSAVPSLLIYEIAFFAFAAAPLFAGRFVSSPLSCRANRRLLLMHLGGCAGVVALYLAVRTACYSEARMAEQFGEGSGLSFVPQVILPILVFPLNALFNLLRDIHSAVVALPAVKSLEAVVLAAVLLFLVGSADRHADQRQTQAGAAFWPRLVATALVLIFLGSVHGFYFRGLSAFHTINAWGSRSFVVIALGFAILIGAAIHLLSQRFVRHWPLRALGGITATLALAGLVAGSLHLKDIHLRSFKAACDLQAQIIRAIPDVSNDMTIVIDAQDHPSAKLPLAQSWGESYGLMHFFDWDRRCPDPPRLFFRNDSDPWWEQLRLGDDGLLRWAPHATTWPPRCLHLPVHPGNIVELTLTPFGPVRNDQPRFVDGVQILKTDRTTELELGLAALRETPAYRMLFDKPAPFNMASLQSLIDRPLPGGALEPAPDPAVAFTLPAEVDPAAPYALQFDLRASEHEPVANGDRMGTSHVHRIRLGPLALLLEQGRLTIVAGETRFRADLVPGCWTRATLVNGLNACWLLHGTNIVASGPPILLRSKSFQFARRFQQGSWQYEIGAVCLVTWPGRGQPRTFEIE